MPSLLSYLFKFTSRLVSARLNPAGSIPRLRALARLGPDWPLLPPGVSRQTGLADGVPVEWIVPRDVATPAVILYLHGGGWTLGWYNSHRWLVGHLCRAAGCRALAVDYRLAPENRFPAALEDCLTAYRWLLKSGTPAGQIVIAGDSAGGNLTLTTLMALRDAGDPLPAGGVCCSPMTDLACTGETFNKHGDALLTPEQARAFAQHYFGSQDPRLPLISPHYGRLEGLPPLLIQAGADEILLSDSQRLADHARAAGVEMELTIWPGMWHVWHIYVPFLPEARQAVAAIGAFVRGRTRSA
jgi:acetyl esterase/lipase